MKECCRPRWTSYNVTGLEGYLEQNLFGQHLALDIIPKAIKGHLSDESPQKPLVLSFHGGTGSGKNYLTGIITQHLYPKGFDSSYVHRILSSHEFPNKGMIPEYKEKLKKMIISGISKCENSLFIIDELDKMPMGLSDVLKPYLDYNDKVDGYSFRKSIFIFMSNTGVEEINNGTLNYWKNGKQREEITRKSMNKLLKTVSYHSSSGFSESRLIDHHLVDFFVPFLPMERRHVKQCAAVAFRKRNLPATVEMLEHLADEIEYFPRQDKVFSVSGCKNVERLVQIV